MKNTKKLIAMIASLALSACAVAPMFSFADETTDSDTTTTVTTTANNYTTFTLSTNVDGEISNVRAYKIFNISKDDASGVNIEKNDNTINTVAQSALLTALGSDGESATLETAGSLLSRYNSSTAETLAKAVAKAVANDTTDENTKYTSLEYNKTAQTASSSSALSDGYYIIICDIEGDSTESDSSETNKNYSVSLGMLTVVDGTTTEIGKDGVAKVGLPTVIKKVLEDDATITSFASTTTNALEQAVNSDNKDSTNGGYNDGADWAIGQTKSFKLYGTLPENYADYDTYYYEFHDTLASQFDAPQESSFEVKAYDKDDEEITLASTDYKITVTTDEETGTHTISVKFENLKSISGIDADSLITVKYDTALNSTANVGSEGQENEVYLEYSNNPNKSGSGENENEHGETPKDKVIVFTYALEFNKTFFEGTSDLTKDEIFNDTYKDIYFTLTDDDNNTIYVVKADESDNDYDYYVVKDSSVQDATEKLELTLVNKTTSEDSDGNVTTTVTKITDTSSWSSASDVPATAELVVRIKGLDSDEYKLAEKVVTDENGDEKSFDYNKVDTDVTINSGVGYTQSWDTYDVDDIYNEISYTFGDTKVESTAIKVSGTADGKIENKKGSTLPSTGGMGTTWFYLGGGAMVAVAGVFLITKKRMGKEEN